MKPLFVFQAFYTSCLQSPGASRLTRSLGQDADSALAVLDDAGLDEGHLDSDAPFSALWSLLRGSRQQDDDYCPAPYLDASASAGGGAPDLAANAPAGGKAPHLAANASAGGGCSAYASASDASVKWTAYLTPVSHTRCC